MIWLLISQSTIKMQQETVILQKHKALLEVALTQLCAAMLEGKISCLKLTPTVPTAVGTECGVATKTQGLSQGT
jgi:hypothetical protein